MSLEPILTAPLAIQLHFVTVVPAFALGTWLLFGSTKGTPRHRRLGKVYLALMAVTAAGRAVHPLVQRLERGRRARCASACSTCSCR